MNAGVVAVLLLLTLASLPIAVSKSSNSSQSNVGSSLAVTVPKKIVAYVPITLYNSQPIATPKNYNQKVVFNSNTFSAYEAINLENIEFFTKSGTIIPSWLESGNLFFDTSVVYWLKIGSVIPADGSLVVYMGFASTTTNLLNKVTTGETPQLSPVYGEYDNGGNVFRFYDSFAAGSSNTHWKTELAGGSFTRNNGLTINFGSSQDYFVSRRTYGSGFAFDALITSFTNLENAGFFNTSQAIPSCGGPTPCWTGAFIRSACNSVYPDQWSQAGEANSCGKKDGSFYTGTMGVNGVYTVDLISLSSSEQSINYTIGSTKQPISLDPPTQPLHAGFVSMGDSLSCQWARVRTAPPNGVMPTTSFGAVQQV